VLLVVSIWAFVEGLELNVKGLWSEGGEEGLDGGSASWGDPHHFESANLSRESSLSCRPSVFSTALLSTLRPSSLCIATPSSDDAGVGKEEAGCTTIAWHSPNLLHSSTALGQALLLLFFAAAPAAAAAAVALPRNLLATVLLMMEAVGFVELAWLVDSSSSSPPSQESSHAVVMPCVDDDELLLRPLFGMVLEPVADDAVTTSSTIAAAAGQGKSRRYGGTSSSPAR
jgi:hypothetical protein